MIGWFYQTQQLKWHWNDPDEFPRFKILYLIEICFVKVAASEMPMAEDSDENDSKPKLDIGMNMRRVSKFYDGPKVRPQ